MGNSKVLKFTKKQIKRLIKEGNVDIFNTYDEVRHMPDSGKYIPKKYDSWKEFWKARSTSSIPFPENGAYICDCCERFKNNFVGGHVITTDNKKAYIYPICKECNDKAKKDNDYSQTSFTVLREWLVPFSPEDAIDTAENQKE